MSNSNEHITKLLNTDLTESKYDLETFSGRFLHFFNSTNPLNLRLTSSELEEARKVVTSSQRGKLLDEFSETELNSMSTEYLWEMKARYTSAYHPETGELQPWWGRMSSQVPMNMVITGAMVALSHTQMLNLFWQLANQTYNSAVNYTNRSGGSSDTKQIFTSWAIASTSAVGVSALAKKAVEKSKTCQRLPSMIFRCLAPFAGIVAANFVNIPVMRYKEFVDGIVVSDENGNPLGKSTTITWQAIPKVVAGRLCIAACCVVLPSVMVGGLCRSPVIKRALNKSMALDAAVTILMVGICLFISVPPALAIWPQKVKTEVEYLPIELKTDIMKKFPEQKYVFYNKGL